MAQIERLRQLRRDNYLGVDAVAEHYCEAIDSAQLRAALAWCRQRGLVVHRLGEGSNVVLPKQLPGLVLRVRLRGLHEEGDSGGRALLRVGAGESWPALVRHCLRTGHYGLENLAGIPGSAGAAPVQNIGAYGVELAEFLHAVEVIDSADGSVRRLATRDCQLSYRRSIFQQPAGAGLLITALWLRLHRRPQPRFDYPSLREMLVRKGIDSPAPVDIYRAVLRLRGGLPNPRQLPNVGSFFRNPQLDEAHYRSLLSDHPELVARRRGSGYQLSAGWMIERAGFKGKAHGGVAMHRHHALVLVNPGGVSGEEILAFAAEIQDAVQRLFGIALELEPRVL